MISFSWDHNLDSDNYFFTSMLETVKKYQALDGKGEKVIADMYPNHFSLVSIPLSPEGLDMDSSHTMVSCISFLSVMCVIIPSIGTIK